MAMWNPWRGCRRYSEGCKFCYIHKGDAKRGVDTGNIVKTDDFYKPMISPMDIEKHLDGVELVVVGGESDRFARPLYYNWVLSVREQCVRQNVSFEFRQCGTHFIKDGKEYTLQNKDLLLYTLQQVLFLIQYVAVAM